MSVFRRCKYSRSKFSMLLIFVSFTNLKTLWNEWMPCSITWRDQPKVRLLCHPPNRPLRRSFAPIWSSALVRQSRRHTVKWLQLMSKTNIEYKKKTIAGDHKTLHKLSDGGKLIHIFRPANNETIYALKVCNQKKRQLSEARQNRNQSWSSQISWLESKFPYVKIAIHFWSVIIKSWSSSCSAPMVAESTWWGTTTTRHWRFRMKKDRSPRRSASKRTNEFIFSSSLLTSGIQIHTSISNKAFLWTEFITLPKNHSVVTLIDVKSCSFLTALTVPITINSSELPLDSIFFLLEILIENNRNPVHF